MNQEENTPLQDAVHPEPVSTGQPDPDEPTIQSAPVSLPTQEPVGQSQLPQTESPTAPIVVPFNPPVMEDADQDTAKKANNPTPKKGKKALLAVAVCLIALTSGAGAVAIKMNADLSSARSDSEPQRPGPDILTTDSSEADLLSPDEETDVVEEPIEVTEEEPVVDEVDKPVEVVVKEPATVADASKEFIASIQKGKKDRSNDLQSNDFTQLLKTELGNSSYYEYCDSDDLCDLYTWFDLDKATTKQEDYRSRIGKKGITVIYTVASKASGSTSNNSIRVSVIAEGDTYRVDDITQSFSGSGSN